VAEIGSFLYIAEKDLTRARIMHDFSDYSAAGRFCEQAVEKCLKSYIEKHGDSSDYKLMSLHKPRRLYDRCVELGWRELSHRDAGILSKLSDYYYDTNYPGNSYFELTESQSAEALELAEKIYAFFKKGATKC